jgi:hypothetical protein
MAKQVKIITLTPTRGIILTETQDSIDRELANNRQIPIIIRTTDLPLPVSRNFLIESALKQDWWTHALLVDEDIIIPEGGLKELIDLNSDVAVMNYPMHRKFTDKYVGTIQHNKDKSIMWGGLGCVLVRRKVFETIENPWFVLTNHQVMRDDEGNVGFVAGQTQGQLQFSAGEDIHFYLHCLKHKFLIKETKKTATHARIDQLITTFHDSRYVQQNKIVKTTKIERETV